MPILTFDDGTKAEIIPVQPLDVKQGSKYVAEWCVWPNAVLFVEVLEILKWNPELNQHLPEKCALHAFVRDMQKPDSHPFYMALNGNKAAQFYAIKQS